jgi:hypothetical protein
MSLFVYVYAVLLHAAAYTPQTDQYIFNKLGYNMARWGPPPPKKKQSVFSTMRCNIAIDVF